MKGGNNNMKFKLITFQKKKKNKIKSVELFKSAKRARHSAQIALVSGFPVRLDKIKSETKKRKRK